jgi:hypothetical protein
MIAYIVQRGKACRVDVTSSTGMFISNRYFATVSDAYAWIDAASIRRIVWESYTGEVSHV